MNRSRHCLINFIILFLFTKTFSVTGDFKFSLIDEKGPPKNQDVIDDFIIRLPSQSFIRYEKPKDFKKSAKILFWSPAYGRQDHWFWWFSSEKTKETCPDINCKFTIDKNELNSSDAIVFMAFAENLLLNPKHENFTSQFPPHRLPQQRWVYYTSEPPSVKAFDQSAINSLFNWTMTYRLDSDIVAHYGKLLLNSLPTIEEKRASWTRNFASGKSKLVAWFVSHCSTDGNRDLFVKEMQKYASVDIYGRCGNLTCKPFPDPECYTKLNYDYKFYLSFENIFAKDYVTEKLFKPLTYDTVPIVFGGADYTKFAPLGSYINALDFDSPKDLVDYLQYLDKNDDKYNKFFDWKRGYSSPVYIRQELWACELCLKLMNPNITVKVYDDMNDWWNKQGQVSFWKPLTNGE